uniref:DNA-directed RNA polymerase III subunit RPC5 n=1 Tax=Spongospora subterranea TaxID=70186 RepID=A0A0H5RBD8_9EUKA|eukprot:CRZ10932.1 hypothetical protein [Spongospora subterranea]
MEVNHDDDDDEILAEIPVYYNSSLNQKLDLLNFPLRTTENPYDGPDLGVLTKLQVKPVQKALLLEYVKEPRKFDDDTNMNDDDDETTSFLLSSQCISPKSEYTIGCMVDGHLQLLPLSTIFAMRPDFTAVDSAATAAKSARLDDATANKQGGAVTAAPKEVLLRAAQAKSSGGDSSDVKKTYQMIKQVRDAEKWITYRVEQAESESSIAERTALFSSAPQHNRIPMDLGFMPYISRLCSERGQKNSLAESDESVQSRAVKLLKNAGVLQFEELCDLLALRGESSRTELLKVLSSRAQLVQNCWVPKSSLLFSGRAAVARDALLQLFSRDLRIKFSTFTEIAKLDLEMSRQIIQSVAIFDLTQREWVFKRSYDETFGAAHPGVVADQKSVLRRLDLQAGRKPESKEVKVLKVEKMPAVAKDVPAQVVGKDAPAPGVVKDGSPAVVAKDEGASAPVIVSALRRGAVDQIDQSLLRDFIHSVFESEGVVTAAKLVKIVRERSNLPNCSNIGLEVIHPLLDSIACPFNSAFCRSSIDGPDNLELNLFRAAAIEMFNAAPLDAFKKADIKKELFRRTGKELPDKIYMKLAKELAIATRSSWTAKTGH